MKGKVTLDIYSYEVLEKSKRTNSYYRKKKDRQKEKKLRLHNSRPRNKRITYFREEDIDNT